MILTIQKIIKIWGWYLFVNNYRNDIQVNIHIFIYIYIYIYIHNFPSLLDFQLNVSLLFSFQDSNCFWLVVAIVDSRNLILKREEESGRLVAATRFPRRHDNGLWCIVVTIRQPFVKILLLCNNCDCPLPRYDALRGCKKYLKFEIELYITSSYHFEQNYINIPFQNIY